MTGLTMHGRVYKWILRTVDDLLRKQWAVYLRHWSIVPIDWSLLASHVDSSVGLWCRLGCWSKYFCLAPVHSMVGTPGRLRWCWVDRVSRLHCTSVFLQPLIEVPASLFRMGGRADSTGNLTSNSSPATLLYIIFQPFQYYSECHIR